MKSGTRRMLKKFKSIDYARMKKTLAVIRAETHRPTALILLDMFGSYLRYGTGYTDYFRGNFAQITPAEKRTFVTARSFYNILHYLNDQQYIGIFHNKLIFSRLFHDYLRREDLNLLRCTDADVASFLQRHPVVFAKDPVGEGGHGVTRVVSAEVPDAAAFRQQLLQNGQYLLEEGIVQCAEVNELNPNVVCSLRIVTLVKDHQAHLLRTALRMNQDEKNVIGCTDDVYCSIGPDGRIDSNVVDDFGNVYDRHPLTGKKFSEVVLPHMDEAIQMCLRAALEVPQVRYVGWDVAFSVNGPLIVEGNEYPGYGLLQFYRLTGKRTGHLKEIRDIIGDEVDRVKKY